MKSRVLFLECKVGLTFKQSIDFNRLKENISSNHHTCTGREEGSFQNNNLFMVQDGNLIVKMAVSNIALSFEQCHLCQCQDVGTKAVLGLN